MERRPKNKQSGAGGNQEKPKEPKWPKQYQLDRPAGPSWTSKRAPRSYADAARSAAVTEEEELEAAGFEEAEEEEEDPGRGPPSPDKAAGKGRECPTARGSGPGGHVAKALPTPLEAQLAALMPTLIQMAAAFAETQSQKAEPGESTRPAVGAAAIPNQAAAAGPEGFGPAASGAGAAAARAGAAPY